MYTYRMNKHYTIATPRQHGCMYETVSASGSNCAANSAQRKVTCRRRYIELGSELHRTAPNSVKRHHRPSMSGSAAWAVRQWGQGQRCRSGDCSISTVRRMRDVGRTQC